MDQPRHEVFTEIHHFSGTDNIASPPPQHEYSGLVDYRLLSSLKEPSALRRRPQGLDKLRRYYGTVPAGWPIK